jgi:hypothetical protein
LGNLQGIKIKRLIIKKNSVKSIMFQITSGINLEEQNIPFKKLFYGTWTKSKGLVLDSGDKWDRRSNLSVNKLCY